MLKQLYIKNFTLIDELNIDFHPGFSVITGETGAGKSIILGAIHLLLGQRADTRQIKEGRNKCIVEAHFDLSNYHLEDFFQKNNIDYDASDCILRREVSSSGKSRAFINDTPVSLTLMRECGELLVDIHSQHQNLLLQKEDFQMSVVDIIADDKPLLSDYKHHYADYLQAVRKYEEQKKIIAQNRDNEEFLRFQYNELDKANLQADEQESLESQVQTLSHIEDIKSALFQTTSLLSNDDNGAVNLVKNAADALQGLIDVYPEIQDAAQRLESAGIELKDIADEVDHKLENIDFDPQQLQQMNDRLDELYSLEKKFHVSDVNELIAQRDQLKQEIANIDCSDDILADLEKEMSVAHEDCVKVGQQLSEARQQAAKKIETEMHQRLVPLGIPKVRFSIDIQHTDCQPMGLDKISFLFSANSSTPLQPVAQVASGGEIARVMLSLKAMISGAVKLPTIIFDEIDTGVSGRVAEKMAETMREMAQQHRQVIAITHLPQIAAGGTSHYKVSKEETSEGTVSTMRELSDDERVREIAQMLSGSDISQAAIDNAQALLNAQK